MKVVIVACTLLVSSGLAVGGPSKRAVRAGEVVPQEDALLEGRMAEAADMPEGTVALNVPTESLEATTVSPSSIEVDGAMASMGEVALVNQGPENVLVERVSHFSPRDAADRQYAAVKMAGSDIWFKFAQGKSYLADGSNTALNSIARLKQGQCLVIVTYRDHGISDADNEALARARAQNIQKMLLALKISSDRIVMLKPCVGAGGESFALFADRVDLKVEEDVNYTKEVIFTE